MIFIFGGSIFIQCLTPYLRNRKWYFLVWKLFPRMILSQKSSKVMVSQKKRIINNKLCGQKIKRKYFSEGVHIYQFLSLALSQFAFKWEIINSMSWHLHFIFTHSGKQVVNRFHRGVPISCKTLITTNFYIKLCKKI